MAKQLKRKDYEALLEPLAEELVAMSRWVAATGARVVVLLEGRDTAGKGGAIKALSAHLNPRQCRVVALPKPSEVEASQWYFQRYVTHLPSAGEIVLFDRSWYNRAGVERVMGFAKPAQVSAFLKAAPRFERMLRATHTPQAPWTIVDFNDQKRGRLTLIRDFLDRLPDTRLDPPEIAIPPLGREPAKETYVELAPLRPFKPSA
ncbi:MAG: polyphosphate kinase 2 [Pseudomonadota bacterium]|jgi:polyphosphate kinase 2 (PPK2 family)